MLALLKQARVVFITLLVKPPHRFENRPLRQKNVSRGDGSIQWTRQKLKKKGELDEFSPVTHIWV